MRRDTWRDLRLHGLACQPPGKLGLIGKPLRPFAETAISDRPIKTFGKRHRNAWLCRIAHLASTHASESLATISPVGFGDPPPGSIVNANALEFPMSRTMAVIEGAMLPIVPADCGP